MEDKIDEILNRLSDSSASRGWLDCKSGSEDTHPRNDLVAIAKASFKNLLLEARIHERNLELIVVEGVQKLNGVEATVKLSTLKAQHQKRLKELQELIK